MNNKALSQVVTIVVFVSLALIAMGIVWAVVINVVQENVEDVDIDARCLKVGFVIDDAECTKGESCSVTLTRGSGGDPVDGFAVKALDSAGTDSSDVIPVDSNLGALGTDTIIATHASIPDTAGGKVVVNAYFTDSENNNALCSQSVEYNNPTIAGAPVVLPGDGEACTVAQDCQAGFTCDPTTLICGSP